MKVNKNLFKQIILGTSVFAFSMMVGIGDSKAVLQSNGNTSATYNVNNWMIKVRQMEAIGGAMGLSESLNSNLTASSESNNIDVHMQKNTEYGAMAILSASAYGNPNKIVSGGTTTGNVTGAVIKFNNEWVAAMNDERMSATYLKDAVNRYKNFYPGKSQVSKKGDAMLETKWWHTENNNVSSVNDWFDQLYYGGLLRSVTGYSHMGYNADQIQKFSSIFSYSGDAEEHGTNPRGDAYYTKAWSSRAVVVIGEGL